MYTWIHAGLSGILTKIAYYKLIHIHVVIKLQTTEQQLKLSYGEYNTTKKGN